MSSNSPSALDQSFPLPSTPTATSPGQVNCVGAKKVLTRDERRLAKMALEARNANRDLTARIKMDFAFMQFKDSEINVLRAKVESLEYENKQLKRAIEALGAGRNKEEMAKKRSGRESREDVAFLAQCVEEIGKLDDVSDASESLLLALPDDPEAARTFVPRDMGPMLGLSTGLDIRDQSGNWVAKRLQVRKSSGIVIDDDSLAENPMPNRLAKTKAAGESGKHSTIGGGRLLGDQDRNPRDKDLGIVEERIIGASSIDHLALPSVAGSMQMVGGLTNFLETLSDNPTTVTKDQQDLEKPKQEVSLNLPKGQAREIGVVGNGISASSRKEASPKSTQDSILEQRQFELCKSFLNDAKKSKIRPSILDSPLVLSPKAPTDLDDVPLGTRENQSGANPMKSQAEITISPPKEAHPSYNYEHIREVVIQNLPTDINYDKLFSCIHGGVVEAVVINMLNLEARIVFMEPESARRFYKAHEREGVWVPRETVGSRQGRKDGVVRCGLGKFLWTLKSAAPSPEMIANVWEHGKTRCLEVRNISGMTVEAIANDIMGYLKPGPTRGDVIESIMARNSDIDGQYIVVIRFTAISYAVSVQNKMAVDKRYLGCVSIFLPDTCGKLIGNRPPDIWFDEPKSLRPPNGASVGGADQGLGPELETVGHFAPKPGLKNWSKHSNQQALLWEPGYALKPEDRKVENQNVSNSATVEEENSRDLSRSVLITNLPCDIDYNTLFSKIRGGRVEHLQIFEPVTSTDSFSALILFVTSTGAQAYRDFIREWPLMVGERRITRKDHIPSDLFSNMNILPASTSQTGVTRCICIYNMREKITEKDVKADLSKAGMTEKLVQWDNANVECSVGEDSSLNLFLRFTSIAGALWARRALQKLERYGGCVFRHARDPCDNGVDELVEARDPAVKQT
ncbi:hypothetical protein B9Z19DRAFT_1061418 [Tuber borchii]|uniref:RRM domain-containing protein n=1 Tax=Tuber borchii TaxID=42251 RepID=A0A2T7A579_TUBBO|nr:hypothetical protein B9Z19DRAFT_1061418 [Tuber borchii]